MRMRWNISRDLEVFQLVRKTNFHKLCQGNCETDKRLPELLKKCEVLFKNDLPSGLLPDRNVDLEVIICKEQRLSHSSLFELPPDDLNATKQYVDSPHEKKIIGPSRPSRSASLLIVKEKFGCLRSVVDYRALNWSTKQISTLLLRTDKLFDWIGDAKSFSRMDLNTGFHQIRTKPEDIEKTACNTKYRQYDHLVILMGLCNGTATFQTPIKNIFQICLDHFY